MWRRVEIVPSDITSLVTERHPPTLSVHMLDELHLEAELAVLRSEKDQLCVHLRMESGPRTLRMVLPLARAIRRISGTRV